ncbi:MAG: hypothetical protein WB608_20880 [Terracidiphilus sp.]
MNNYSSRDLLISLRNILAKLETIPDHDRPGLPGLKRILHARIAELENSVSAEFGRLARAPIRRRRNP